MHSLPELLQVILDISEVNRLRFFGAGFQQQPASSKHWWCGVSCFNPYLALKLWWQRNQRLFGCAATLYLNLCVIHFTFIILLVMHGQNVTHATYIIRIRYPHEAKLGYWYFDWETMYLKCCTRHYYTICLALMFMFQKPIFRIL